MNTRLQTRAEVTPAPSFRSARIGILQRKSTFGVTPGLTGEFTTPRRKPLVSQPPLIQPKLTIGQPNDWYEQEADRVADLVMRMPDPRLQRQVEPEEEETLQAKPLAGQITPLVQRQVEPEEEEEEEEILQTKAHTGQTPEVTSDLDSRINSLKGSGQPLAESTRSFFEPRFGHDFSRVRIHTDTRATETARAVSALSFTVGRDVVFGAGQYAPGTTAGRKLLAHELTHVVQQQGLTGHVQRMLAGEAECPGYEPGEARTSRTSTGQLSPDVTLHAPGRLLIADFGVNWRHVKRCTQEETLLKSWLSTFESDDSYRLSIAGYSDCVGSDRLNTHLRHGRAERVERLLGPSARSRVTFRGMAALGQYVNDTDNNSVTNRAKNRAVIIEFRQEFAFPPMEVRGIACPCDPATERYYDSETFRFLTSIEPLITSIAGRRGSPTAAVAGAIADEYDTRRGWTGTVDSVQDSIIDALPEFAIDIDRFFDIHAWLLNTLENDIGPANIKVRTALELVQRGELAVPGSPPSDVQVNRIVDFLLTERGTAEATTAVIARAQRFFGPHLTEHGVELAEAVLVEYFKQGDSYYNRFLRALDVNPDHKICPGDGGCRFWHNRARILTALHPP